MNIRRTVAAVSVSALALAALSIAPAFAADPLGTWLTGDQKGKIRIVNCGGAICGNLVWLAEPNDPETHKAKTDDKNADVGKRERPLLGIPVVLNMRSNGTPDKWDGQVYNSRDGQTYSGSFTLTGPNSAELKGCVAAVFCKSETWTRSN